MIHAVYSLSSIYYLFLPRIVYNKWEFTEYYIDFYYIYNFSNNKYLNKVIINLSASKIIGFGVLLCIITYYYADRWYISLHMRSN